MRAICNTDDQYWVDEWGIVYSTKRGAPVSLAPKRTKNGYFSVGLWVDGVRHHRTIHRLVAEAFIPNPCGYEYVLHKNDIKTDNRVENLYWGTHQDNMDDMVRKGRSAKGVRSPNWRGAVRVGGVIFPCCSAAAEALGVPYKQLYMRLHRGQPGYSWV